MKFNYAAVLLAVSSVAVAQSIADLPTCSISCLTNAISTSGCGVTDYACQCGAKKADITNSVTPCIQKACSADDQAKVLQVTNAICASVGGGSSSAQGGSSATSAATAAASSASKAASSASSAASAASSAAGSVTSAASSAKTSASAAATQSTNAAARLGGAAGALFAAAGVLAL